MTKIYTIISLFCYITLMALEILEIINLETGTGFLILLLAIDISIDRYLNGRYY